MAIEKEKKSKHIFKPKKIGILGGGQLARMMSLKTHELGLLPIIYSEKKDDPAALTTTFHFQGSSDAVTPLKNFLSQCDVVTFESEFLNGQLLAQLSQDTGTPIYPSPLLMEQLQDRATQKRLLHKFKIPTSQSMEVANLAELELAINVIGPKLVLKKRRFGYDGYGTFFIDANKDQKSHWKTYFENNVHGFIAEKFIPFKRELAILLARDLHGQVQTFPLVESKQTNARCDWVMGPIVHPRKKQLTQMLSQFVKKIDYVGVIAFELFDTGKELLINEIAPRVHNSGHYSQNALEYDQFQTHIMAISGFKLPQNQLFTKGFAMANLLGESNETPHWPQNLKGHLHWYEKSENRKSRKMGHINMLSASPKKALSLALKERKKVKL